MLTRKQLAQLAADMRHAQRKYFQARRCNAPEAGDFLEKSKDLERRLDDACHDILTAPRLPGFED